MCAVSAAASLAEGEMLEKTRSAVVALTAFVSGALSGVPTVARAPAGPGFHVALSHRRRLRLRRHRNGGLRQHVPAKRDCTRD
jgi:hypothetical protein